VKHYFFEEERQVEIPLTHPERLRDYLFTPEPVARADFFVNCPKFKAHPWTTVTFSNKAYIGIQDDRHRLIDHDHRLNEKIADLQYIIQPQFICIDAITAGEGRMLTPIPYDLNLIVMGNNSCAFDAVCCAIIGVDPHAVDHIRFASERGFGTLNLDEIGISGDVTLEQAKERGKNFRTGLIRVEKYFEGSHISAYAGPPPKNEHTDYCWGGCPGAECDQKMARMHVVFGAYQGPIDAQPGEKVVFIGDCVNFDGKIGDQLVQIRSTYQDRATKDPYKAQHDDIFAKLAKVKKQIAEAEGVQIIRFEGCPVSVAEHVLFLAMMGHVKNPYTDAGNNLGFVQSYLAWRGKTMLNRLRGVPYQVKGPSPRGAAKPEMVAGVSAPPPDAE